MNLMVSDATFTLIVVIPLALGFGFMVISALRAGKRAKKDSE